MEGGVCPVDMYYDPLLENCEHCVHICHPRALSPDCTKYCPNYHFPGGNRTRTSTSAPTPQRVGTDAATEIIIPLSFGVSVFAFVILMFVTAVAVRDIIRSKRQLGGQRREKKFPFTSKLRACLKLGRTNRALAPKGVKDTEHQGTDAEKQALHEDHLKIPQTDGTDSGQGSSMHTTFSQHPRSDSKQYHNPADGLLVSAAVQQVSSKLDFCSADIWDKTSEVNFISSTSDSIEKRTWEPSSDRLQVPAQPVRRHPDVSFLKTREHGYSVLNDTMETVPKSSSTESSHQDTPSPPTREQNEDAELSLSTLGVSSNKNRENVQENGTRTSTPSSEGGTSGGVWDNVMKLYAQVEAKLIKFSWIVGCRISNTALEVMISREEQPDLDTDKARDALCAEIGMPKLHHLLKVSEEEGLDLVPCYSKYGSASAVYKLGPDGTRDKSATVTIAGRADEENYVFSVAHFLEDGQDCVVDCVSKMNTNSVRGRKVNSVCTIDYSEEMPLKGIKDKIYDIALMKLNEPVSQKNGWTFVGREENLTVEKTLTVSIEKQVSLPLSICKSNVLIYGGPEKHTNCGIVKNVKFIIGPKRTFECNFLEIEGPDGRPFQMEKGHSGSLVTTAPDVNGHVKAVAYVIGYPREEKHVAVAVPLWGAMIRVCTDRNLLKRMTFCDVDLNDSGFESTSPLSQPTV